MAHSICLDTLLMYYYVVPRPTLSISWNFFSSRILLGEETNRLSLARPVFNTKAMEFRSFFAYFHLFRHLKVIQHFQKYAKNFIFDKLSEEKNCLKIALQVSKLGVNPIVGP